MMEDSPRRSVLAAVLLDYINARQAALAAARRELGVNEMDARTLLFVADHPGARPSTIRDHLGVTSAGVTTMIDRLVDRGLVRREYDETDRRVIHVLLTVDLREAPWSALTRFDSELDAEIVAGDQQCAQEFAAYLAEATVKVSNRR